MMLNFDDIINLVANSFFDGSTTFAALLIMVGMWAICAVICMNMKASPAYSVVPLIPISIFFVGKGMLSSTIMVIIIVVVAVLVASEFKKVVD